MNDRFAKRFLAAMLAAGLTLTALPVYATEGTQAEETTAATEVTPTTETVQNTEPTPGILTVSDDCLNMIKGYEGFSLKPYWDYGQYTVGYGTRCPDDMLDYYKEHGITEAEAELLLRNHVAGVEQYLHSRIIDKYSLTLSQQQFDALISFSYNVGTAWMTDASGSFFQTIVTGVTDENQIIDRFSRWCHAGGSVLTALVRRRLCEANLYVNGQYSQIPPANYCYVLYNANGGKVSSDIQGFNASLTAPIGITATYADRTFEGWYTAPSGGNKVEILDANVGNLTLFAHWASTGESGVVQPPQAVAITVTGNAVNLRQGPGTNHSIVGRADAGDKLTVTQIATGGEYVWGQTEKGWICLKYTNYDAVANQPTEPQPTEPQPTEPQPTEPQPTEPQPTEPPAPAVVTGTVKVNDQLRIRSGPGTGYGVAGYLKNGDKVQILEQQTIGAMVWGRMDRGWISMDYIVLDTVSAPTTPTEPTPTQPAPTQPAPTTQTGTVKVSDTLRIRSGAGTNHAVAGYLRNGEKVEILETTSVGGTTWGRVSKGWISLDYVVMDASVQTPEQATPTQPTEPSAPVNVTGTIKVGDVLRIRSGPGTNHSVAGYLRNGERVQILEQQNVGGTTWGRISKGWISMAYVTLDQTSGQPVTKTVTADCLRVRQSPGTGNAVVGYYYSGARIQILETTSVGGSQWGRTAKGWISMDYVR